MLAVIAELMRRRLTRMILHRNSSKEHQYDEIATAGSG
jgi:hypothetical protein